MKISDVCSKVCLGFLQVCLACREGGVALLLSSQRFYNLFEHKICAALQGGRARRAGLTLGGLVALVVETGWVAGFGLVATLLVVVE
ncbi:hypothetical protein F2Q68_00010953 [Brassica cretica]|uniref:Uncharacterized protein n=1 Tax=Brassica cretica TaxID=69181 RepID=A0A8S9KU52_BRACR|nr:hypothetical protein F2Q68_00010953 [Brassica cretica]